MTTTTIKVGGSLVDDPGKLAALVDHVQSLREDGVRPCLVHGGGPQTTSALEAQGFPERRHEGLRITPPDAAEVVRRELDAVGKQLAAHLARAGLPVFHVDSHQERLSAQVKQAEVDLGRVGEPTGFDGVGLPGPVGGRVPVVTPVGADAEGPLNVNADEAAACIAPAIGSDALVLATDVDGVQDGDGSTIERLSAPQARRLVDEGTAHGGMIPKLRAAIAALDAGVSRAYVGDPQAGLPGSDAPDAAGGTRVVSKTEVPA